MSRDESRSLFEAIVLLGMERMLTAYCATARTISNVDPGTLTIRVVVITTEPVRIERRRFYATARRVVREALPGARIRVTFAQQELLAERGYRVTLDPPMHARSDAGPTAPVAPPPHRVLPERAPRPDRSPVAPGAAVTLTLHFGEWRWHYMLPDVDIWVPLGRGLAGIAGATVRIPDFAAVVPRGPLLLVRHFGGVTRLCRSDQRRKYLVRVDDQALPPGRSRLAGAAGRITYGLAAAPVDARHTEVGYEFLTAEDQ